MLNHTTKTDKQAHLLMYSDKIKKKPTVVIYKCEGCVPLRNNNLYLEKKCNNNLCEFTYCGFNHVNDNTQIMLNDNKKLIKNRDQTFNISNICKYEKLIKFKNHWRVYSRCYNSKCKEDHLAGRVAFLLKEKNKKNINYNVKQGINILNKLTDTILLDRTFKLLSTN